MTHKWFNACVCLVLMVAMILPPKKETQLIRDDICPDTEPPPVCTCGVSKGRFHRSDCAIMVERKRRLLLDARREALNDQE